MSTSKVGAAESEESAVTAAEPPRALRRPRRNRKYKPKTPDLVQDADVSIDSYQIGMRY